MSGKKLPLHEDGVQRVTVVYDPKATEEIALECEWIHDLAVLYLNEDELELIAKRLKKAVKKVRRLKAKNLP